MKLSCMRAGFVLQRRAAGLSAAAGLFLEEHLASCAGCRETANLLSGLRQLHLSGTRGLSVEQRERVIEAALASASAAQSRAPARLGLPRVQWLMLPAFAALALLLGVRAYRAGPGLPTLAAPKAGSISRDRVLSGQVDMAGAVHAAGQPLTGGEQLRTATGAVLALAHATAELRAATSARWDSSRHELQLLGGSVLVDVNEGPHQRFVVKTDRFSVLVLGTRFEVSLDAVKVVRGRVRVLAPSGSELAVLDGATQSTWQYMPTAVPVSAAIKPAPAKTLSPPQPDALLEQAQRQLVAHQVSAARRSLEQAMLLSLTRGQKAEALSLRAECALVVEEFHAARDLYLKVAQKFGNLPAGETALFAAARIEAEHGPSANAARLLNRYLERYPHGRFVKEAGARLRGLSVANPSP
jgi:hypothetical protein